VLHKFGKKRRLEMRPLARTTLTALHLNHHLLSQIADWLAVAVAVALPWSTSATQILGVAWLMALVPTLKLGIIKRELISAAGGLPVLLWWLAVFGMLWAHVSWGERLSGLDHFYRLLTVPLLLAQFRRSTRGRWVMYGFLISSCSALVTSFVLIFFHSAGWRGNGIGVSVHDDNFQSSAFVICAFALLGVAWDEGLSRRWPATLLCGIIAVLFFANFALVQLFSRITLAVVPVLAMLFGWRCAGWKGTMISCAAVAIFATGVWVASPSFRTQLHNSLQEFGEYRASEKPTPIGMHVAFLKESLAIIASAPVVGHGTGSIPDEFRKVTARQSGAPGIRTDNPHNQTFAIAIQLGLAGAIVLWAMWISHLLLFRGADIVAWVGTVIVVENIVSSSVHSHLFDFANGWLYIFGVGVLGGMMSSRAKSPQTAGALCEPTECSHGNAIPEITA
jgi:O-antigen ligase